jgi:hypothetical protein
MSTREALAALIERFAPNEGPHDTCCGPRVGLYRVSQPSEPTHAVHEPAFCVLAQGRKRVLVGDAVHHYDDRNFFLASIDVPVVGQVIEASPEAPYLSFRITLDPNMISEMIMETGMAARLDASAPLVGGMSAGAMTPALFDAACRMVRLMDCPNTRRCWPADRARDALPLADRSARDRAWPRSLEPTAACVRSTAPSAGSSATSTNRSASRPWPTRRE